MTRQTSPRFTASPWVCPLCFFCCNIVNNRHLVLHPQHKLKYFKNAGWPVDWIHSAWEIVHAEIDQTYMAQDIDSDVEMVEGDKVCLVLLMIIHFPTYNFIGCLNNKHLWCPAFPSCTHSHWVVRWTGPIPQHWPWAHSWCACLMVWTQKHLSLTVMYGAWCLTTFRSLVSFFLRNACQCYSIKVW